MEEKIKLLEKELKYLTAKAKLEEIEINKHRLEKEDVRNVANDIYLSRGLDVTKLKRNITSNLISDFSSTFDNFKNRDKSTKKNMIIDIVFFIIVMIFMKIPFDLVRDIGYEYIELLSTNNTLYNIWNFGFLIIYTIILICVAIVCIRNFNSKYKEN